MTPMPTCSQTKQTNDQGRCKIIGSYLVDTVVLRKYMGMDEWQEPVASVDASVKALIEYGEHRIQNESGEVVVSMAKVYMRPRTIITTDFATRAANTISYKDVVIFDGIAHAIMRLSKSRDFTVRSMDVYVA